MADNKQYIEIVDGKKTIKVELNKFFNEAVKELVAKSPKTIDGLIEQLEAAKKQILEKFNEEKPRIDECFKDVFGRSYFVVGKNTLGEEKSIVLRRGMSQYTLKLSDLYEKNGEKKKITNELLEQTEVKVMF